MYKGSIQLNKRLRGEIGHCLTAFVLSPVFAGVLPTVLLSFSCCSTNQKFFKTCQAFSHTLPLSCSGAIHKTSGRSYATESQAAMCSLPGSNGWRVGAVLRTRSRPLFWRRKHTSRQPSSSTCVSNPKQQSSGKITYANNSPTPSSQMRCTLPHNGTSLSKKCITISA